MSYGFLDIAATPSVKAAQVANGSAEMWANLQGDRAFDRFTENEIAFIHARDSLYMATVSETGWPYLQHRGGPPGFVRVLDAQHLGFADFTGNRQHVSIGNLATNDRVALFFMDYANRRRLKRLGHARVVRDDPALLARLTPAGAERQAESAMLIAVAGFEWNCPQHITPRFSADEWAMATGGR